MDLGPIMDDPLHVKWNRKDRGALVYDGAELEAVALRAAADLQPVVALITSGATVDDSARALIKRAFDALWATVSRYSP